MDIKTKQFDDYEFKNILRKSIQNIKDSTLNYRDSLYAYCPKLQKYTQWIGLCMHCFVTHGNQKKSFKMDNSYFEIKESMFYEMLDIVVLENHLSFKINTMLNKIQKEYCNENVKSIEEFINEQLKQLEIIVDEQVKANNLLSWCQKQQLHELKQVKQFVLRCQLNYGDWLGYCGFCRKEEKHRIMIKYSNESVNRNGIATQNKTDIGTIKCEDYSDYRLIDTYEFHSQLRKYIKESILELINGKKYEAIQKQQNDLIRLEKDHENNIIKESQLSEEKSKQEQSIQNYKRKILNNEESIKNLRIQNQRYKELCENQVEELLYDIQINCEQLLHLTTDIGWKVIKNEFYDKIKENLTVVVSFYGLYNKGKSFLAQKLSGKQIQTGYSVSTIGLSAIYPRDIKSYNSIVFLDTAGLETPIPHHRKDEIYNRFYQQHQENDEALYQKIYEAKLRDRLLTENLIQQFVLNQSNLILIIVDQLSKEEQKLIKRIRTKYQQSEIIIIHNFSKLTNLDEVQKYIQIDIINSFEKIELQYRKMTDTITGYVYIEERFGDNAQQLSVITHLVMAREYSKAGEEYNYFCYKYLESRMISITQFKKFDIIKSLMTEVEKEIVNLFKLNSEQKNHQYALKYDENKNAITANLENIELKSISFDMLGDMQVYNEDESPKYQYLVTSEQLILCLELYGKFEPQKEDQEEKFKKFICKCEESGSSLLEWHGFRNNQDQFIQLRAQYYGPISKQLQKPDNNSDPYLQRIKKFQLVVPISPVICVLKPSRPNFSFKLGIAKFEFSIQKTRNLQE